MAHQAGIEDKLIAKGTFALDKATFRRRVPPCPRNNKFHAHIQPWLVRDMHVGLDQIEAAAWAPPLHTKSSETFPVLSSSSELDTCIRLYHSTTCDLMS